MAMAEAVVADIARGAAVAVGFECPLIVPVPDDHARLGRGRAGDDENRAWSAPGGAGALAIGLVEAAWYYARLGAG